MPEARPGAALETDPVHRLLEASGAGWRAAQPEPGPVDPAIFAGTARHFRPGFGARTVSFAAGVVATLVIVVLAAALAPGWFPRLGAAAPGPSGLALSPRGGDLAHCPVTKPAKPFQPPTAGEIPATKAWYGNVVLWTWLDRDGEVWEGLPRSDFGLTQKTFWWSTLFNARQEPQPEIYVTGSRIGAPGRFGFGPGTNAGGDFGSAMLVGIDVPGEGCWNITAHYRGAKLAYVVWAGPRT